MESLLKCNTLMCRVELKDQALVTSCLHIFCLDCAGQSSLTTPGAEHLRQCPACRSALPTLDHATIVNLRPSDEYKCSILRGLSPAAVIDCANAALSFWEYQMAQEIVYHSYFEQTLTEKYSQSRAELEKMTGEANGHIGMLSDKLAAVTLERDNVRRKNEELVDLVKEKSRKLVQVQELYDKLKRKAMLGQLQDAATEAVDSALDRVAAAGPTPLASRTRPGLYQQQAEPGYQNAAPGEGTARPSMHPGLCKISPRRPGDPPAWDQAFRRTRGITATPTNRTTTNASGISLSNLPGLVVGGAPMLDGSMRDGDHTRGFGHLAHAGISSGYGANQRVGPLAAGGINISDPKPRLAQRSGALFAPQPREGPSWRPS